LSKNAFINFKSFNVYDVLDNSKSGIYEVNNVNNRHLNNVSENHNSCSYMGSSNRHVNMYNSDNVDHNTQSFVHVISEVCESTAAQRDASDNWGTAQASDINGDLVSAQVYAHNTVWGDGNVFVRYENEKLGENSGVTTGSIEYSANREVLFTQVSHTPGEGQSSGGGAQVQYNNVGVTSLSNWG
jgi:hypothetical protein